MAQAWRGLSWFFKYTYILLLPGPPALSLKQGQKTQQVPKELLGLDTVSTCMSSGHNTSLLVQASCQQMA